MQSSPSPIRGFETVFQIFINISCFISGHSCNDHKILSQRSVRNLETLRCHPASILRKTLWRECRVFKRDPLHLHEHIFESFQEAGRSEKISFAQKNCEAVVHKASSVEKSVPIVPTKRIRMFHHSQDFQSF